MSNVAIDAMIAVPNGDTAWKPEADAAWTEAKARVHPTHGGLETVVTANTSTSYAINLVNGNYFDLTLTGNAVLTLTGSTAGKACRITVIVRQDGTGGRTITWPGSVKWVAMNPTWTTTASKISGVVELLTLDNGTTWLGFWGGSEQ